jgi:hypothetical protein
MPVLLLCPGDARLEVATVRGETFGQLKTRMRGLEPERVGNKLIRLMFRGRILADTDALEGVVPAPDEDVIHAFLSEPVAPGVRARLALGARLPGSLRLAHYCLPLSFSFLLHLSVILSAGLLSLSGSPHQCHSCYNNNNQRSGETAGGWYSG